MGMSLRDRNCLTCKALRCSDLALLKGTIQHPGRLAVELEIEVTLRELMLEGRPVHQCRHHVRFPTGRLQSADQICLAKHAGIPAARSHSDGAIIKSAGEMFSQDLARG